MTVALSRCERGGGACHCFPAALFRCDRDRAGGTLCVTGRVEHKLCIEMSQQKDTSTSDRESRVCMGMHTHSAWMFVINAWRQGNAA